LTSLVLKVDKLEPLFVEVYCKNSLL